MPKRRLVFSCLLLVSVFALVACGSGNGDESKIEEAIETSATSKDPADCKKLSTQHFMEQTTRSEGAEAVKECEKNASNGEGAKSVEVSEVEVDGSKATADAALTGGSFDGQTLEVALVKENDQWKLDELAGFVKFDEAKVVGILESQFDEPSSGVSKSQASCIVEAFEEAPQAEFEEALLSGASKGFEEIAEGCL
ncbi:MAG TPA: hypothetical protein VHZ54_01635 [Solirubrobacterales bacterium]|nr:hypothetical protein [Solirubrobacterales bacterium]